MVKIILVIVFVLFFFRSVLLVDPDFGWHVRMGELIQKSGIPKTDPFSYTMPSYPFVDYEWFINILLANLHHISGTVVLSFLFSSVAICAIGLQIFGTPKKWHVLLLLLACISVVPFVGIRPQLFSWLFLSILTYLAFDKKRWNKFKFFLPLLFLLWVNIHGGFIIGLIVVFITVLADFIRLRKIALKDIVITLLCAFSIMVNPYGIHLPIEVLKISLDRDLHWTITEWMPAFFSPNIILWIYVVLNCLFVARYKNKLSLLEIVLFFLFLVMGLSSIRHMPLFVIVSLPIIGKCLEWFKNDAIKTKDGIVRIKKAHTILLGIVVFGGILISVLNVYTSLHVREGTYYPKDAVSYLQTHKPQQNVFSIYNWGGYLIWKLPEKKVFVDGRMPTWDWDAPQGESTNAWKEQQDIVGRKTPFKMISEKYLIDTVLLPHPRKKSSPLGNFEEEVFSYLGLYEKPRYPDLYMQLKQSGYKKIYEDSISVIYQK